MQVGHKPIDGATSLAVFSLLSLGSGTDTSLMSVGEFPTTLDALLAGRASAVAGDPGSGEKEERAGEEGEGGAPQARASDLGYQLAILAGLPTQLVVAAAVVAALDADGAADGADATGSQPSLGDSGFARGSGGARGLAGIGFAQATGRAELGPASLGSTLDAPVSEATAAAGPRTTGEQESGGLRLLAERASVFETESAEQFGRSNTDARGPAASAGGEGVEPTASRNQIRPGLLTDGAGAQQAEVRPDSTRTPTLEPVRAMAGRENEARNPDANTRTDIKAAVSGSRLAADPGRVAASVKGTGPTPSLAAAAADGETRSSTLLGLAHPPDRGVDASQTKSVLARVPQLPTGGGEAEIRTGESVNNPRGTAGGEARSLPGAENDRQRVQVQTPAQPIAHGSTEVAGVANRGRPEQPGLEVTTAARVLVRCAGGTINETDSEPPQTGAKRNDSARPDMSAHKTAAAPVRQTAAVGIETHLQQGGTPGGQVAASRLEAHLESSAVPEERSAAARVGARLEANAASGQSGQQVETSRVEGHTEAGTAPGQQVATSRIQAHVDAGAASGQQVAGSRTEAHVEAGAAPGQQLAASRIDAHIERAAWAERLADSLRVMSIRNGGEMRLALEPEGLGHIDVRVTLHHDGLRAVIVAEHDSTRALLNTQQHVLQAALERSSLRLAGFSIDLGLAGGGGGDFGDSGPWASQFPMARPHASVTSSEETDLPSLATPSYPGRLSVRV